MCKELTIVPTKEQMEYTDWVISRMDTSFFNDYGGELHTHSKWVGKLGEVLAADLLGIERPHQDANERIVPDQGKDFTDCYDCDGDAKVQKFWTGFAVVDERCMKEKKCDYFMFFHYDRRSGNVFLKGTISWYEIKHNYKPVLAPKGNYWYEIPEEDLSWPYGIEFDEEYNW